MGLGERTAVREGGVGAVVVGAVVPLVFVPLVEPEVGEV
jgi:hypothetical protein